MLSLASYSPQSVRCSRCGLLVAVLLGLLALVQAEPLSMYGYGGYNQGEGHMRHDSMEFYAPADRGCAMCRNGENCSIAVRNASTGVFCGDVLSTFQPCCCTFRNECMTTIFSDSCECFDGAREEEMMTTRFYLFVGLSIVAWALLVYDKMCAGPYKVMNSNHQLLASTPSAARARGENSIVDTVESDSEDERTDGQRADGTATVAAATVVGTAAATAVAVEVEADENVDDATAPLQSDSSSPTTQASESDHVEVAVELIEEPRADNGRQERDETSIQSV